VGYSSNWIDQRIAWLWFKAGVWFTAWKRDWQNVVLITPVFSHYLEPVFGLSIQYLRQNEVEENRLLS